MGKSQGKRTASSFFRSAKCVGDADSSFFEGAFSLFSGKAANQQPRSS
jgi:hypothetical protein